MTEIPTNPATEQPTAVRPWSTRALVEVTREITKGSVDPYRERTFRVGEQLEMIQWGIDGRPVDRDTWWTSTDIDGAFVLPATHVQVIRVIADRDPMVANCGAKKPGGYTYNVCHGDEGHGGTYHHDAYGDRWPVVGDA